MSNLRFVACALLASSSLSCAALFSHAAPAVPPTPAELHALPVVHGADGKSATWNELRAAIDAADVVVFGELHGHPVGLPFHAQLFQESLATNPDAALCLEFLTRETQYLVDAYLAGIIDWDAFVETLASVPGSTPLPHRPLIAAAHQAGIPVIAANAPRIYTRAARTRGYDTLTTLSAEQKRLFDVPTELPDGAYRERFFDLMRSHGEEPEDEPEEEEVVLDEVVPASPPTEAMEAAFRSQALWDGTMSASAVRSLAEHRPVFLVVGSFHCNRDGGTQQLLRRARPEARIVVISFVDETPGERTDDEPGLADFVAYVGPYPDQAD